MICSDFGSGTSKVVCWFFSPCGSILLTKPATKPPAIEQAKVKLYWSSGRPGTTAQPSAAAKQLVSTSTVDSKEDASPYRCQDCKEYCVLLFRQNHLENQHNGLAASDQGEQLAYRD